VFQVTEPPKAEKPLSVAVIAVEGRVRSWLKSRKISVTPLETNNANQIVLVGNATASNLTPALRADLLRRIAQGSVALFLDPGVFQKDNDPVGWLPLKNTGHLTVCSDWLYHKECVARRHPAFAGLPPCGIMDWDYYGPLISSRFFEGQDTPNDVAAAAFAVCHSSRSDGYAAGVMLGTYNFGAGRILLNTFNLLDQVDKHPAADRLLLNLIAEAAKTTQQPSTPLPGNFDATLKDLGY
jgi:hypothetical protein